ncbi:UBX domain-containing protein 1-like [Panonychus citri]|uniref:UBX domain-containing protein 1-like n=1 Tax=Panonychus citri TaxID=50023 RepID=UPI0023082F29|nr:UBX domain-containing protein 1-like [Panonychus citri]
MSEMREYIVIKLKEMGFDEAKIERACNSTTCESLDQVMEWIITESEREFNPPVDNSSSPATATAVSPPSTDAVGADGSSPAKDSNLPSENVAANLSKGLNDGVATEEKKVKTAEEIEAEKKKLEDKIKQRRLIREEEERKQAIEKEKKRRETGSEISKFREQYETQEKIRIAQEIRKEKLEREAHKNPFLQIKKDREAMKRENQTNTSSIPSTSGSTPSKVTNTGTSGANASECKLAIRLPDGSSLIQKFTPNEQLAAVRLFIQLNRKDLFGPDSATRPFKLHMPPNKAFTEEDMERTLLDLGLCPSARLFLTDIRRP